MLTLALKRLRGCTSLFDVVSDLSQDLTKNFTYQIVSHLGKFANFYFVFSHHNSSEPEEKIKREKNFIALPALINVSWMISSRELRWTVSSLRNLFLFFSFNSSRIRLRLCKHWWNSLLPKCPEKGLICFTISEAFLCKIIHQQSYREKYPSIQAKKWKVFCYLRITHASSAV